MLFYCESYVRDTLLILDVKDIDELSKWWGIMEFQNWNSSDKRSLIEIKDIKCPPYHGPREGYWYKLNRNFWEDFEFDFEKYSFEQKNKSLIFRVSATYKPKEECNFYSYKVANIDEK